MNKFDNCLTLIQKYPDEFTSVAIDIERRIRSGRGRCWYARAQATFLTILQHGLGVTSSADDAKRVVLCVFIMTHRGNHPLLSGLLNWPWGKPSYGLVREAGTKREHLGRCLLAKYYIDVGSHYRTAWDSLAAEAERLLSTESPFVPMEEPAVAPELDMPVNNPASAAPATKRFAVAFSFPGEKRDYVKAVDKCLTKSLPKESVFYDERFPGREIGHLNLDTRLQNIYYEGAELVVVFLCAETNTKQWCGVELRAVRARMMEGNYSGVMMVRFDDTKVDGFFPIDGYIDARKYGPDKAAEFILEKLEANRAAPKE